MDISILVFTGYTLEKLESLAENSSSIADLLFFSDMLIDGCYMEELKRDDLYFRGSSNQRLWLKENGKWILDS